MGCRTAEGASDRTSEPAWPVFAVPRMNAILLNGDATDWREDGFRVDALIPVAGPMPAQQVCAASMRLGWNDAGLLVLLDVSGSDWNEAEAITELFKRDSVEFYLALHPGSTTRCQWVVAPGMDPLFPDPRVHLQMSATSLTRIPPAVSPDVARMRTESGYRMEVLLPWQTLGITPRIGDEVAFQVMVNSHDRKGRPADHLLWFPMIGAAFDSRKLHRIRLADTAAPPVTARARVRANLREDQTEGDVFAPAAAAGRAVRLRSHDGILATGVLGAATNGYASTTLIGPGTDGPLVWLDVDGELADLIPLGLPRAEMAIETRVRLEPSASGLTVVLSLPDAPPPGYRIARRQPGEAWQVVAERVSAGEFRDTAVRQETRYEYAVTEAVVGARSDYFWVGSALPLRDTRGSLLLLVERAQADALAPEIRRLTLDLVGDGWHVIRHDVSATQSPSEIRQLIRSEYDRASADVNTVLLMGHVPVPYSGNVSPDGHGDHAGAWPADVYYGALEGTWTDETVTNTGKGRQRNVPGDGTVDQNQIPGPVQLAVGRVDFANMPAFRIGETNLLRRYLDRDHAYRHAQIPVADRGLIHDGFFGHLERFAYSGWQNFTTLLPPENVRTVTWPNVQPGMSLFFSGCGPGAHKSMKGFGDTAALVKTPVEAVFSLMFGSYFGDWNTTDNLMRAVLAHERGALTCGWAGRPHWYLHAMGLGETIGDALRRTQNNDGRDYQPTGAFARGIHVALLGDPTLRLHPVPPPAGLRVQSAGRGVRLDWQASPQQVNGYHVYRAHTEFGPYERITKELIKGVTAADPDGTTKHYYQVRAVVLQESTTGSYFNSSQGIFTGPSGVDSGK